MSEIAKEVGKKLRQYRLQRGLSQEKVAELADCHPTYIGQLERGEKNATLESVEKIASALDISLATLFKGIGNNASTERDIPKECYEILLSKSKSEQELLYKVFKDIESYKAIK